MRWQCGHHVANSSSMYGLPANVALLIGPSGVCTSNTGAGVPTLRIGGTDGTALGATAALGSLCICDQAYTAIAMMTRTPAASDAIVRQGGPVAARLGAAV